MKDNKFIISTNASSSIELKDFTLHTKNIPFLSNLLQVKYRGMSNEEFKEWFVGGR